MPSKKDTVMADAAVDEKEPEEKELLVDTKAPVREEVKSAVLLILQATETKELRTFTRITRYLHSLRKRQTVGILASTVDKYYPAMKSHLEAYSAQIKEEGEADEQLAKDLAVQAEEQAIVAKKKKAEKLAQQKKDEEAAKKDGKEKKKDEKDPKEIEKEAKLAAEKEAKDAERKKQKAAEEAEKLAGAAELPEVKAFVHYLVCAFLVDQGLKDQSAACAKALVDFIQPLNQRSMDHFSAKAFHMHCVTQERLGGLEALRSDLLAYHRTAVLQHNEPGQAMLVVCILRSFLAFKLYAQADNFRLKTSLPESRDNDVYARYLYYVAQINAVQLQYSDAFSHLQQAARKAPQNSALGFRQSVNKLLVIVQLLMGEIPERSIFATAGMRGSLKPYFELTQAVRVGDLQAFERAAEAGKEVWERDGLSSLIARVRNNVIKTGLRKINLSYSRISLEDIRQKLNLASVDDAEFIASKCIHDGVIDAVIDREQKFMFSKERKDKYATHDPQAVLHKRTLFCMDVHNGAVKALRFPPNVRKPDLDVLRDDEDVPELEADSMDDD
jgi:26S proteasome regulatory subunit N3